MKQVHYNKSYWKERIQRGVDWQVLRRLFHYLQPYRTSMAASVALMLLARAVEATVPLFMGSLAQHILQQGDQIEGARAIFSDGLCLIGLLFAGYLFDATNVFVKNWVGQRALLSLRTKVFDHIQKMPIPFFDRQSVGRLMSRSIHDVEQINQMYSESLVPLLGNVLLLLGVLTGVFYLNWRIACLTLAASPFLYWLTRWFHRHQRQSYELIRAIISALNSFVQEQLMGAMTVWRFGSHNRERAEFEKINEDHCTAHVESIQNLAFFISGIDFLHSVVLVTIFTSLVALSPIGATFDSATFFTFSLYASMVFRPISDLAERYNVLQSALVAGERILDILDRPTEPLGDSMEFPLDEIEQIRFENVWFAYQGEHWILKGLSFELNRGESIALVGLTGAGKTSVLSLLLRFYDFQKGSILINGRDIRQYALRSLRQQFSTVLQDTEIFTGSFADNISLFQPEMPRQRIEAALDEVELRPLIYRHSDNLDHRLTERGLSLSAGERQLLSLARAVAHQGSLFLLDEATAHVDTESERKVQKALQKILKGKTAIVIAHRLSTIQHVSRILVLHEGKVAESGSHHELLKLQGIYEKLYRLQFSY